GLHRFAASPINGAEEPAPYHQPVRALAAAAAPLALGGKLFAGLRFRLPRGRSQLPHRQLASINLQWSLSPPRGERSSSPHQRITPFCQPSTRSRTLKSKVKIPEKSRAMRNRAPKALSNPAALWCKVM